MSMFDDQGFDEGTYETLQACENGHLITERLEEFPERGQKFCQRCSAKTTSACGKCGTGIRGHLRGAYVGGWDDEDVPAYCHDCGKPYPWRSIKLLAAQSMADEVEGLNDAERVMLKTSIEQIATDTPMTEVAAVRIKKLIPKVAKESVGALRRLIIDVAGKTAAELMKGG